MQERVSGTPQLTDPRWWALKIEGAWQGIVNAEMDKINLLTDGKKNSFSEVWDSQVKAFSQDYKTNKEVNQALKVGDQKKKDLINYYKAKKNVDDFERWKEDNPEKASLGDAVENTSYADMAKDWAQDQAQNFVLPDNGNQDKLIKYGVIGLGILLVVNIFK